MIYFAITFVAASVSLFVWLTTKAFRTRSVYGLGWSVTKADRPAFYWAGVAAYLLNVTVGLLFLAVLALAALHV